MLERLPFATVALLACVALAAAGCGSGSKSSGTTTTKQKSQIAVTKAPAGPLPRPTESLSAFEKRLAVAVRDAASGNCGSVAAFGKTASLILPCKGKTLKGFTNFKVTGGATYGTGAVVEFTDSEVAGKRHVRGFPGVAPARIRNTGVYPLALSPTGRYVYAPVGAPPVFPGPYTGTKAAGWTGADSAAITFLNSVRDANCAVWFKNTITPTGMSKKRACQLGLTKAYAPLRDGLNAGQPVKLFRLGGNAVFYFYGLRIGNNGGTVVIARGQPPAPAFIAIGVTPAPAR